MAKRRSVDVYNTIPKSQEWLTINCAMMQGLFCQGSTFFKEKDYGMITLNFGNQGLAWQCKKKLGEIINYKNINLLRRFISKQGRILQVCLFPLLFPRYINGNFWLFKQLQKMPLASNQKNNSTLHQEWPLITSVSPLYP